MKSLENRVEELERSLRRQRYLLTLTFIGGVAAVSMAATPGTPQHLTANSITLTGETGTVLIGSDGIKLTSKLPGSIRTELRAGEISTQNNGMRASLHASSLNATLRLTSTPPSTGGCPKHVEHCVESRADLWTSLGLTTLSFRDASGETLLTSQVLNQSKNK